MPSHSANALVGIRLRQSPRGLFVRGEQNNERPLESQQERRQGTFGQLPHLAEGPYL